MFAEGFLGQLRRLERDKAIVLARHYRTVDNLAHDPLEVALDGRRLRLGS